MKHLILAWALDGEMAEFVLEALIGGAGDGRPLPLEGKDPANQEANGRSGEQADSEIRASGHHGDSKRWKEKEKREGATVFFTGSRGVLFL